MLSSLSDIDDWELSETDISIQEVIGQGSFGTVHRGVLQLTASSPNIERFKLQKMARGESVYTVAVKFMNGKDDSSIVVRIVCNSMVYIIVTVGCVMWGRLIYCDGGVCGRE